MRSSSQHASGTGPRYARSRGGVGRALGLLLPLAWPLVTPCLLARELAPNPGFEAPGPDRPPSAWSKWGEARDMDFVLDDAQARNGACALKLTDRIRDGNSYCSSAPIHIEQDKCYLLRVWARAARPAPARLAIQLLRRTPKVRFIGWVGTSFVAHETWTPAAVALRDIPPAVDVVRISLAPTHMRGVDMGTVWFDDVSVSECHEDLAAFGEWLSEALAEPTLVEQRPVLTALFSHWEKAVSAEAPDANAVTQPLRRRAAEILQNAFGDDWVEGRLGTRLYPSLAQLHRIRHTLALALEDGAVGEADRDRFVKLSAQLERAVAQGAVAAELDAIGTKLTALWDRIASARRPAVDGVRPRVGLYVSISGLVRARELIRGGDPWARRIADEVATNAKRWAEKEDSWFLDTVPGEGSLFTYGYAGCPKCKSSWPRFGSGVCSWDRPGKLLCPHCKTLFPDDKPVMPYYDDGSGLEVEGNPYYLVGTWNAWVVNQMYEAVEAMLRAYLLTEDENYAHKSCIILDKLATVCPTTKGPVDIRADGRFHHLTSIVNRYKMRWANWFDILYHSPEFAQPSATNPTNFGRAAPPFTIRDNVEQNLLMDYIHGHGAVRGGPLRSLHNHTGDAVRATLAVGRATGRADMMRAALAAVYRFYENTIDRDGRYYESAVGYANFTRELFMDMACVMADYSPYLYDDAAVPMPADYPHRLNLYDHPKLQALVFLPNDRVDCAGYLPGFGDSGDAPVTRGQTHKRYNRRDWAALSRMVLCATDARARAQFAEALGELCGGDPVPYVTGFWDLLNARWWDVIPELRDGPPPFAPESDLVGNKAMAILRSGCGTSRRAAFLRGGTTLAHGHDDVLQLQLYDLGLPIGRELGYGLYGVPTHFGYAARAYAHNLVVVNEEELAGEDPRGYRIEPGTVRYFAPGPPFQAMQMDATLAHRMDGVSLYRRTVVMADVDADRSYYVDFFDVRGGWGHDYVWHTVRGSGLEEPRIAVEGAELAPAPGVWTLAGLSGHKDEVYDAPGMSWGERILPAEKVAAKPNSPVEYWGWRPPPGNGTGFLFDVRRAAAAGTVAAEWPLDSAGHGAFRLTMLPVPGSEVVTATGPELSGKRFMKWFLLRRRGKDLTTRFRAVLEPYEGERAIHAVEAPAVTGEGTAVLVRLADGRRDLHLHRWGKVAVSVPSLGVETDARLLSIRRDGEQETTLKAVGGTFVTTPERTWRFVNERSLTVTSVDGGQCRLTLDGVLPAGPVLAGAMASVANTDSVPYSHSSPYRVESVSTAGDRPVLELGRTSFSLGRGRVLSLDDDRLVSDTPFPYAYEPHNRKDTLYFRGKLIRTPNGTALIKGCPKDTEFRIQDNTGVRAGDDFEVLDVKAGDTVRLVSAFSAELESPRVCCAQATGPLTIRWRPGEAPATVHVKANTWASLPVTPAQGSPGEVTATVELAHLSAGTACLAFGKHEDERFESEMPIPRLLGVSVEGRVLDTPTRLVTIDGTPHEVRVLLECSPRLASALRISKDGQPVPADIAQTRKGLAVTVRELPRDDWSLQLLLHDPKAIVGRTRTVVSVHARRNRTVEVFNDDTAEAGKAVRFTTQSSWLAGTVTLPAGTYAVLLRGYGAGSGANSMFISVDGQRQDVIWHLPIGAYGPSSSDWDGSGDTPRLTLKGDGPHHIRITLREGPPQVLDSIVFQSEDGEQRVNVQAETWEN